MKYFSEMRIAEARAGGCEPDPADVELMERHRASEGGERKVPGRVQTVPSPRRYQPKSAMDAIGYAVLSFFAYPSTDGWD